MNSDVKHKKIEQVIGMYGLASIQAANSNCRDCGKIKHYAAPQQQATEPAYCRKCDLLASLGMEATAAKQQRKTAAVIITAAIEQFKQFGIIAFTADFLAAELPQISRRFVSAFLHGWELKQYDGTTAYYLVEPQQQQIVSSGWAWSYDGKKQTWRTD